MNIRVKVFSSLGLLIACMTLLAACGTSPDVTATPTPTSQTSGPSQGTTPTPTAEAEPTPSFDAAAHFTGRTVTIVIGFGAGGGFDAFGRFVALHAPKHIPGNPQVIAQNLPGADSLLAGQRVAQARPDGLTWGLVIGGLPVRDVLSDVPGFDASQMIYLGTPDGAPSETFIMARSEVASNANEFLNSERALRCADFRGGSGIQIEFLSELGASVQAVYGWAGASEALASLNRGETDCSARGDPILIENLFPEWKNNQFMAPVMFYNQPCCEEYIQQSMGYELPPTLMELVQQGALTMTDLQKNVYEADINGTPGTRLFILTPETPPEIEQVISQALMDTFRDPEFLADMESRGFPVNIETGAEVTEKVERLLLLTEEERQLLSKIQGIVQ